MFYVIALERVTVTKSFSETFQEGRIISRHKSEAVSYTHLTLPTIYSV